MSNILTPSEPSPSENLPNAALLAIVVLSLPSAFFDPTSNIPSTINARSELTGSAHHTDIDSQGSSHLSNPGRNDSSPSSGFEDISDASETEKDSNDSSPDSSPPSQLHFEPAPISLSRGANSSLSNPLCPIVGITAEALIVVEDPAGGDFFMDIMSLFGT
ncbi:hypothetical protein Dimus_005165 [Dionaea muscipula]